MNSTDFDVKQIHDLARRVLWKLGEVVQADAECMWHIYEDEQIRIDTGDGSYYEASFRVGQKHGYSSNLVLETHQVRRRIDTKDELLRDMLHHGFCDGHCPGFSRAVAKRAHEIYLHRTMEEERAQAYAASSGDIIHRHRGMNLSSALDDWLQAEKEILQELEKRYSGDWEVSTLYDSSSKESRPVMCVILKRGAWVDHLVHLAATCS